MLDGLAAIYGENDAEMADSTSAVATMLRDLAPPDNEVITEVLQADEDAGVWFDDLAPRVETCCICAEELYLAKVIQLPCADQHWVCYGCLPDLFEHATTYEYLFPPRCCEACEELRITDFEHLFTVTRPALAIQYSRKADEYHTYLPFRRRCAEPSCKEFLSTERYSYDDPNVAVGECGECNTRTCVKCGHLYTSQDHECEKEAEPQEMASGSAKHDPKFCPYCGKAVVLGEGCNHITCHCGNQWCFICLRPWKGLHDCNQYNEPGMNDPSANFYDAHGFGSDGYHRITQLDREGFNREGTNIEGKTRSGEIICGFAKRNPARFAQIDRVAGYHDVADVDYEEAAKATLFHQLAQGVIFEADHGSEVMGQSFGPQFFDHGDENEEEEDDDEMYMPNDDMYIDNNDNHVEEGEMDMPELAEHGGVVANGNEYAWPRGIFGNGDDAAVLVVDHMRAWADALDELVPAGFYGARGAHGGRGARRARGGRGGRGGPGGRGGGGRG